MKARWLIVTLILAVPVLCGCPSTSPPNLSVTPTVVDFGSSATLKTLTIRNTGGQPLVWQVEENLDWLEADVAGGVTTPDLSDILRVTVSREGLNPGRREGTFDIRTADGSQSKTVRVSMTIPGEPLMGVTPEVVDIFVRPGVSGQTMATGTFAVTNNGTDTLRWAGTVLDPLDPNATFDYLSFEPTSLSGQVIPGAIQTVRVIVDPELFEASSARLTVIIQDTETLDEQTVAVRIASEGAAPAIGVSATALDFGDDQNTLTFDVFNTGEAGSLLEFSVSAQPASLLAVTPTAGTSIGTGDPQGVEIDAVTISVDLDRASLTSNMNSGTVTVSASGLDAVAIPVSFEKGSLILEGAQNRTRNPYILRFTFLVRNSLGEALDTHDPFVLEALANGFRIEENDLALDINETDFFITGAERLTYNVVVLLDYSGSMYAHMRELYPDATGNPLHQLYAGTVNPSTGQYGNDGIIAGFLDPENLPASFNVALMEHHERQQSSYVLHNFSRQRGSIINALRRFNLPAVDHGASELYDAVVAACTLLEDEDAGRLSFDDADVRAVILITDGRDTSSVSSLQAAIDFAKERRVRLYPIAFGDRVNGQILQQMARETGGHYHPAANRARLNELLRGDAGRRSLVAEELRRQVVLTYISLFQEGSNTYRITLEYDGEQGSFERDAVVAQGGDVRAGQIALLSSAIDTAANTATVTLRTDYVPRNISQFRIRGWTTATPGVPPPTFAGFSIVPENEGGLLGDWVLVPEVYDPPSSNPIAGSVTYNVLTTEDDPLRYGAFGDLVRFQFSNVPPEGFTFHLRVDNRLYVDPPVTKYFQYPTTIAVSTARNRVNVVPILLADGFDPDAENAWDPDEDGVTDFDDRYPDDPAAW